MINKGAIHGDQLRNAQTNIRCELCQHKKSTLVRYNNVNKLAVKRDGKCAHCLLLSNQNCRA